MQSFRLDFDCGHSLLCLTRDKERTYEAIGSLTMRQQQQLQRRVQGMPEAMMMQVMRLRGVNACFVCENSYFQYSKVMHSISLQ